MFLQKSKKFLQKKSNSFVLPRNNIYWPNLLELVEKELYFFMYYRILYIFMPKTLTD